MPCLTARDQVEGRVKGLELGVDDYLVNPSWSAKLLVRVHPSCSAATSAAKTRTTRRRSAAPPGIPQWQTRGLMAREFGLLELLMRRHGEVLPHSLIASQV